MKAFLVSFLFIIGFVVCLVTFTSNPSPHHEGFEAPVRENPLIPQKQAEAIQKQTLSQNAIETSSKSLEKAGFQKFLKAAFESLPKTEEIKASTDARSHHDTPESIMRAGSTIGAVADQIKKNKANVEAGLKFFKTCAENPEIVSSVRAVCLRNLVDFSSRYRNNVRVSFADYPYDVQRIARHIPRLR